MPRRSFSPAVTLPAPMPRSVAGFASPLHRLTPAEQLAEIAARTQGDSHRASLEAAYDFFADRDRAASEEAARLSRIATSPQPYPAAPDTATSRRRPPQLPGTVDRPGASSLPNIAASEGPGSIQTAQPAGETSRPGSRCKTQGFESPVKVTSDNGTGRRLCAGSQPDRHTGSGIRDPRTVGAPAES